MSDLKSTAKTVRGLAHQFRALADIGEVLDRLGDLEAQVAELNDRREVALMDKTTAERDRDAAEDRLSQMESLANAKQKEIEGIVPAAQAEAVRVKQASDYYARQVRQTAEENARQLRESVATGVLAEENRIVELRAEADRLTKQRDELKAEIDRLRQKFGG